MAGIDLGTLRARITLDSSEANRGLSDFQNNTEQLNKNLKVLGAGLTATGTAGVLALGKLVQAGGEWDAQVAGTDFLMKNLDKSVQKTINSNLKLASKIGLTTQQYKDGAVELATYFKNMGLTSDQMNKMSGEAMELIADLGAVKDIPFDEALARFKSGLMGNYEALDAFGISISASMLENTAFVKSLGKSWNALSDNEKMLAVYNEIMRQGATASGLATQEAEQYSIQMQLLKTNLDETAGTIGRTLLPVMTPFVNSLNDNVEAVKEWVELNPELTQQLLTLAGAISGFMVVSGNLILLKFALKGILEFWTPFYLGAVALGEVLKTKLAGSLITTMLNFELLKDSVALAMTNLGQFMMRIPLVNGVVTALSSGIGVLVRAFTGLTLFGKVGVVIGAVLLLGTALLALTGNLDEVVAKVKEFVSNGLSYLQQNLPKWLEAIKQILSQCISYIQQNLPQWLETGKEWVLSIYNGLIENIPKIIEGLTNFIITCLNFLAENYPVFAEKGAELLGKLAEGIAQAVPTIIIVVTTVLLAFLTEINNHLPEIIEAGISILEVLITGIINALPKLIEAGLEILVALVGAIIDNLPLIVTAVLEVMTVFINTLADNLPYIIESGGTIIGALVEGVITLLPLIITTVVTLIGVLLRAIVMNLPKIIQAGGQILKALAEGIMKVLGLVGDAVMKIIDKFVSSVKSNAGKVVKAGADLLISLVKGIGSNIISVYKIGINIAKNLLQGIKDAWGGVKNWVSGKVDSLFSSAGKSRSIDFDMNANVNDNGISTLADSLTGNGFSSNPSNFGFTPASRSLLSLDIDTPSSARNVNSQDVTTDSREIVINNVLEVDGYTLAKSTARQMLNEINNLERRNVRLGGVF